MELFRGLAVDAALLASEETFRHVVSGVPEYAVFLLDADERIATWNLGAQSAFGYQADEIVGRPFSDLFPRDMAEAGTPGQRLEQVRDAGPGELEGWRERKDGSWFWAAEVAAAVRGSSGAVQGYCIVLRDLTKRRLREDELRKSEQRHRLLVEGVREYAIFLIDREGCVASWNAGARRLKGYEESEIIGQHISRFYSMEDVQDGKPDRLLQAACRDGQVEEEGWQVRRDGGRFWANVVVTALFDSHGNLQGYSRITRDLTERKRQDESLRSVVDNVIDGIITVDDRGIIESLNPAAERIFGYTADALIGENIKVLVQEPFHCEDDDAASGRSSRIGKSKLIGVGREVMGRRHDGSTFPIDLAVSAFRVGERRYFTGIIRDITESKRLEQELRDRVAELAEADNQKNDFLAMLGHELRNPLAPIRNALHILKMPGASPESVVQAREAMERQVQHVVRLVDDLLDVSRIMRAKIDLRKEIVDLSTIVQRAVETAQPVIDAQGHELTIGLPAKKILVEADVVRMAQVISNLLMNAAKYTDKAGRIWLTVEHDGPTYALIKVKDSGIGIPPDLLPRIFDLFVQGRRSLARSQGGLGIGLTLAKNLVDMHGGTIEVASPGVGQGSEFTVRLPVYAPARAEASPESPTRPMHVVGRSRRVLVVDDNVDAAEMTASLLRMWGHEVQVLHDGASVLEHVLSFQPEVVLLDIGLPGMSGYDVAQHLRQQPQFKSVVLAAMTGYGQFKDRQKSLDAGFDYHMTKPIDPSLLEAFVAAPHSFVSSAK